MNLFIVDSYNWQISSQKIYLHIYYTMVKRKNLQHYNFILSLSDDCENILRIENVAMDTENLIRYPYFNECFQNVTVSDLWKKSWWSFNYGVL